MKNIHIADLAVTEAQVDKPTAISTTLPCVKNKEQNDLAIHHNSDEVRSDVVINQEDAKHDIDIMLWSMRLCSIRRYFHQRFWEAETQDAEYAARVESNPRLESVAEHSWHVADTVLILGEHFPQLNVDRCLKLAILHDKMEIIIGDKNPVGRDGAGKTTHAFNVVKRRQKDITERKAISIYLSSLRASARKSQSAALHEILEGKTEESRFVKAVDKLQALSYVLLKKRGDFKDKHLKFTLRYSEKALEYYPLLQTHYKELRSRLILQVARRRNISVKRVEAMFHYDQLPLNFPADQTQDDNDEHRFVWTDG